MTFVTIRLLALLVSNLAIFLTYTNAESTLLTDHQASDSITLQQKDFPDFITAMLHNSKQFNPQQCMAQPAWQLLQKQYEKAITAPFSYQEPRKIPPHFHLIWLGGPVPSYYYSLIDHLKKLHPNHTVHLWTDKEAATFPFTEKAKAAFLYATNQGEKADVFRYVILAQYGGVYLDGDFEIIQSLDDLFYATDFFAGIAYNSSVELYNGLIGAAPGHPIITSCLANLEQTGNKKDFNAIFNRTGPHHFTRSVLEYAAKHSSTLLPLPVPFFYPWPNYDRWLRNANDIKKFIKPYSYTIHKWAASWTTPNGTHKELVDLGFHAKPTPKISTKPVPQQQKSNHNPAKKTKKATPIKKKITTKEVIAQHPNPEIPIKVLTLTYNNEEYAAENLLLTLNQNYTNFEVILINDNSDDKTEEVIFSILKDHPRAHKVRYIRNQERRFGMANHIMGAYMCEDPETVMVDVDGDDCFAHENALARINKEYQDYPTTMVTYGSYSNKSDGKRGMFSKQLEPGIIKKGLLRKVPWVTTHARSYKTTPLRLIYHKDLQYKGTYLRCATDMGFMYPLIELAGEDRVRYIPDILISYRDDNPNNVYKIASKEVQEVTTYLRKQLPYKRLNSIHQCKAEKVDPRKRPRFRDD